MSINKQLRELYVNHIDGLNTMYGQLESHNIRNYTARRLTLFIFGKTSILKPRRRL